MFTIIAGFGAPQASAANLNDISGHWAQSQIENLVSKDIIKGYPDNTFKPEKAITRAELAVIVNKAFSFTNTTDINFKDVKSADWFAPEIAKAKAAGYISGYPDGTMKPNQNISRQEAAVMIAKAAKLDTSTAALQFKDAATIGAWSRASIAAAVQAGYIKGYPDGKFLPLQSIKRAEAATIISLVIKPATSEPQKPPVKIENLDKAGTYGPATGTETIKGNVTISAKDVILQNTIIDGDLIIAKEVGDGNVTLNNVTVKGKTYVRGGGKDSIHINGGQYSEIIIEKTPTGQVRIVAVDASGLKVTIAENAKGEEVILNGDIKTVTVKADDVKITTQGGTKIGELKVDSGLKNVNINLAKDSTVNKMVLDSKATVTGEGTTKEATGSKASESSFTTAPGTITKPSAGGGGGGGGGGVVPPAIVAPTVSNISLSTTNGSAVVKVVGTVINITVDRNVTYDKASVTLNPANQKTRVYTKGTGIDRNALFDKGGVIATTEAIKALTGRSSALGSDLLAISPITVTLYAVDTAGKDIADKKTTYTVNFEVAPSSAPTISNIKFGGVDQVIGADNKITIIVESNADYNSASVDLDRDAHVTIKVNGEAKDRTALVNAGTINSAIAGLTAKDTVKGQELLDKSPITVTLTSVDDPAVKSEYTVTFMEAVKLGTIADQTVIVGKSIDVPVTVVTAGANIKANSNNEGIATVDVAGTILTITGKAVGTATITVTGKKDGLVDATITFNVEVTAAPPAPTVQSLGIEVIDTGLSTWFVDIPIATLISNNITASAQSEVSLNVGGKTITLEYYAKKDSFRNGQIPNTFKQDELLAAEVIVETFA